MQSLPSRAKKLEPNVTISIRGKRTTQVMSQTNLFGQDLLVLLVSYRHFKPKKKYDTN